MSIEERKQREKEEMRNNIISAALNLFRSEGYEKVTIRKIAQAIDYSPGTIYLYFEDKDDIIFQIYDIGFTKFYEQQLAVQSEPDPLVRMRKHGIAYLKFAIKYPEFYDLMFIAPLPMKRIKQFETWTTGNKTHELLLKNIAEAQAAGHYTNYNPEVVALGTWAFVHGISALHVRGRLQHLPDGVLDSLIEPLIDFLG